MERLIIITLHRVFGDKININETDKGVFVDTIGTYPMEFENFTIKNGIKTKHIENNLYKLIFN
jgi:hypothetical protein